MDVHDLTVRDFAGPVAGGDPRAALMWPPRARDVAGIAAAIRAAGERPRAPRVLDAGAGSGLLAWLLSEAGCEVTAVDPGAGGGSVGRFHAVTGEGVEDLAPGFDAAVLSWMEAGCDYRDAVTRLAPVIVQARDAEGGCGVRGATRLDGHGFALAISWSTPSWEDVAHAWRTRGRGPGGQGLPRGAHGNVLEVWVEDERDARAVHEAVRAARPGAPFPWEKDLDALGVT